MAHPRPDAGVEKGQAGAHIVAPIGQWGLKRFRNDDRTGEHHDRGTALLGQNPAHQIPVAHIAVDEHGPGGNQIAPPGGQIVQHHHLAATGQQFQRHMTADIAGTAGDENGPLIGHAHSPSRSAVGEPEPKTWS